MSTVRGKRPRERLASWQNHVGSMFGGMFDCRYGWWQYEKSGVGIRPGPQLVIRLYDQHRQEIWISTVSAPKRL